MLQYISGSGHSNFPSNGKGVVNISPLNLQVNVELRPKLIKIVFFSESQEVFKHIAFESLSLNPIFSLLTTKHLLPAP